MKYHFLVFIPFFIIAACSSGEDDTAPAQTTPDSPFSTQLNALESAKQVSGAATESINQHQHALEAAKD